MKYQVGCKINLNLHIVGRREDGYHLLDSLFYPIPSLYDTIYIDEVSEKEQGIQVLCETKGIDLKDNTLTKAYNLFTQATNFKPNIVVDLQKNIPHGAGLGGGSADGALILKYLYMKWKNFSSIEEVEKNEEALNFLLPLAVQVGADVPFFIYNKPMRAKGIGEILENYDAKALKGLSLLLICPNIHVNTAEIFKNFKKENPYLTEKVKKIYFQDLTSELTHAINALYPIEKDFFVNDLEETVFRLFPKLGEYKQKLRSHNAKIALMSGSGSSLFAIYGDKEQAKKAKASFDNEDLKHISLVEL